jgi:hypothetical protein
MVYVLVDESTGDHKEKWLSGQYQARRTCHCVPTNGYKDVENAIKHLDAV